MKTIYILPSCSDTIPSRLVRLIMATHYTHVSMSFNGASPDRL